MGRHAEGLGVSIYILWEVMLLRDFVVIGLFISWVVVTGFVFGLRVRLHIPLMVAR